MSHHHSVNGPSPTEKHHEPTIQQDKQCSDQAVGNVGQYDDDDKQHSNKKSSIAATAISLPDSASSTLNDGKVKALRQSNESLPPPPPQLSLPFDCVPSDHSSLSSVPRSDIKPVQNGHGQVTDASYADHLRQVDRVGYAPPPLAEVHQPILNCKSAISPSLAN